MIRVILTVVLVMIVATIGFGQAANRIVSIQATPQAITPPNFVFIDVFDVNKTYVASFSSMMVPSGQVTGLAPVATSGFYGDLTSKPTIPSNTNQLTNGSGFITGINGAAVIAALGYTPTNPNGTGSQFVKGDGTFGTSVNGTVTSVGVTSTDFSVSGSPVTSSGTITANLNTSGVTAGSYDGITVNNKGIVTAATATNDLIYGSGGLITNRIKRWVGTVTPSTSNGYSIDISSASFGTILSVNLTAFENVATEKGAFVSGKTKSTTAVVVNTYRSKNTGILIGGNVEGLEFHPTPANVSICVVVTGY